MADKRSVDHVKIAEYKVVTPPALLKATLGSCVGIAFLWHDKKRYALAHCLLPAYHGSLLGEGNSAKYVTLAVPLLIQTMKIGVAERKEVEVQIAGGSLMNEIDIFKNTGIHIGEQNINMAKKVLGEAGFKIKRCVSGLDCAVQMELDADLGSLVISTIKNSEKTILEPNQE